jgi:hypothetical protein
MESKEFHSHSKEITNCNIIKVSVKHNGYCGGDSGHGGFVEIEIKDLAGTDMSIEDVLDTNKNYIVKGKTQISNIKLIVQGDSERDTLIEALEFVVLNLKKITR